MSDSKNQTASGQEARFRPSAKGAASDGAVFVDKEGNQSNWELAEQMLEGVDELAFMQRSAQQLIDEGYTPEKACRVRGLTPDGRALRVAV